MKNLLHLMILISLWSCSSKTKNEEAHKFASWNGRPLSALLKHRYFKNLPIKESSFEDGTSSLRFLDQSKFQTGAYCQSLGGCLGMPSYNCQYIVKLKDEIITGIDQQGTCPDSSTTSP